MTRPPPDDPFRTYSRWDGLKSPRKDSVILRPLAKSGTAWLAFGEKRLPLDDRPILVGRLATCQIVILHDPNVSRRHARIFSRAGGWFVEDLGSTNGTFINRNPVPKGRPAPLKPGDSLTFGAANFEFYTPPPPK